MKILDKDVSEIKEYELNPRFNDNAVDKVAASIKEFGFKVPIIIDKNNEIVAGHTRYKAAKELGIEKVPCLIADDLSPEQVKAFRLADNKVSEYSTWDEGKLYNELMELQTMNFNVESFGFNSSELTTTTNNNLENEEDPEHEINPESNFNYKEQYGVIVMCKNEAEQEEIFTRLHEEGYECKVVAT